jgi:hypothetical protein
VFDETKNTNRHLTLHGLDDHFQRVPAEVDGELRPFVSRILDVEGAGGGVVDRVDAPKIQLLGFERQNSGGQRPEKVVDGVVETSASLHDEVVDGFILVDVDWGEASQDSQSRPVGVVHVSDDLHSGRKVQALIERSELEGLQRTSLKRGILRKSGTLEFGSPRRMKAKCLPQFCMTMFWR